MPAHTRIAVLGHHDPQARDAAAAFIRQLGLQTTTLPEPSRLTDGAYFDRLEGLADLQFAIVLVPAAALDTAAGAAKALPPDLMLELGFLMGTLGRGRIGILVSGPAAKPPPWDGVVGLPMDDAGVWHLLLARALKQAGLDVDLNRAV